MKAMTKLGWGMPLLVLLAGCATSARLATEDARGRRGMRDPAAVGVYAGKDIGRPYQAVGTVIAAADGESGVRALEELRKEAALLGADAVVDLRLEIDRGFWSAAVKATGVAVVTDAGGAGAKGRDQ